MIKNLIYSSKLIKDNKNRNILYIENKNEGYIVQDKNLKKLNLYKNRYFIIIILIALISTTGFNITYCIPFGIFAGILLEYNYRKKFLTSLTKIEKFKYEEYTTLSSVAKDKTKQLIIGVLYLIFGVLFVVNGVLKNQNIYLMIFNVFVLCCCVYIFFKKVIEFKKN